MGKTENFGYRVLKALTPVMKLIPEVTEADRRIPMKDRLIWTVITLLLFLICSQIPLYGILKIYGEDHVNWMKVILASNRGSLMELGISPIITSGMILQLLVGAKIIEIDMKNKEDRDLYEKFNKFLAMAIGLIEAVVFTWTGTYGDIATIGALNGVLIVAQLTLASV